VNGAHDLGGGHGHGPIAPDPDEPLFHAEWERRCFATTLAMGAAVGAILLFKLLHDFVRARNERLVRGYAEIAGRVTALFTGSFAIEMILVGIDGWLRAA